MRDGGATMAFRGWERTIVETKTGPVEGVAPVIISASRSTDIPAFFGDWFMERLKAGYTLWTNPFNRQTQVVSFEKTRAIVFWTKNARPIFPHLERLDEAGLNYYFTFTINDYEREGLEPNVPPLKERMETFRRLSERLGPERVIWRYDPIVIGGKLTPDVLVERIKRVGDALHGWTRKLVISFADINAYAKVRRNLESTGFGSLTDPLPKQVEAVAYGLQTINRGWGLEIASCAEKVNLERFGISHNRCIDDELMMRVFGHDQRLMEFLGRGLPSPNGGLFGTAGKGRQNDKNPLKDKGQREACGCIVSKDIGEYNTCMHLCRYCYANGSEKTVREHIEKMKRDM